MTREIDIIRGGSVARRKDKKAYITDVGQGVTRIKKTRKGGKIGWLQPCQLPHATNNYSFKHTRCLLVGKGEEWRGIKGTMDERGRGKRSPGRAEGKFRKEKKKQSPGLFLEPVSGSRFWQARMMACDYVLAHWAAQILSGLGRPCTSAARRSGCF